MAAYMFEIAMKSPQLAWTTLGGSSTPVGDSGSSSAWSPLFNGAPATGANGTKAQAPPTPTQQLDTDTINFIHRIYCRECRMEAERKAQQEAASGGGTAAAPGDEAAQQQQPPQAAPPTSPMWQVEEASLAMTMDTNKESLKRKLMLRRSVNELVDQGIYPPLKTPPAYAEQRKQLERAKLGDQLKHKIQQRPDRDALVQQHILEDTNPLVDSSLQAKQRQLKRARLQDSLSDRLANRPGPLELVKGNILQVDPQLQGAVQEGRLSFQSTSDALNVKEKLLLDDDDSSNASDGEPSPQQLFAALEFGGGSGSLSDQMPMQFLQMPPTSGDASETPSGSSSAGTEIPAPPDITPLLEKMAQANNVPLSGRSFIFTKQTVPSPSFTSPPSSSAKGVSSSSFSNTNRLNRIKKPKPKSSAPKSKIIKFHEYKGPPNVVKSQQQQVPATTSQTPLLQQQPQTQPQASNAAAAAAAAAISQTCDTPYHILLQQQQLFLQWQLEYQHTKNLPIIIPTAGGSQPLGSSGSEASVTSALAGALSTSSTPTPIPTPPGSVGAPTPTPPPPPPPPLPLTRPLSVPATSMAFSSDSGIVTSFVVTTATSSLGTASTTTATPGMSVSAATATSPTVTPAQQGRQKLKTMEDFKVAELKAECKKRGLTVSGPKPVLIERLKNFQEEILSAANSGVKPGTVTTPTSSKPDTPVTSPVGLSTISGVINIQPITPQSGPPPSVSSVEDSSVSMTIGSPPLSPTNTESELNTSHTSILSGPLSPPDYNMDIASPSQAGGGVKNELNGSQTNIPMAIDNQALSRPPSVAPMDVDLGGSVNLGLALPVVTTSDGSKTPTVAPLAPPPPPPPPLPPSRPGSVVSHHTPSPQQILSSPSPRQTASVASTQMVTAVSTGTIQNVMSPPQLQGQPQLSQAKLVAPQALQLQLHSSQSSGNLAQSFSSTGIKLSQSLPQLQAAISSSGLSSLQPAQVIQSLTPQTQVLAAQTNMLQQQLQQLQQNQQQIAAGSAAQRTPVMLQQIKAEPQSLLNKSPVAMLQTSLQPVTLPVGGASSAVSQEERLRLQQSEIQALRKKLEMSEKQQKQLKRTLAEAQAAAVNLVKIGATMQSPPQQQQQQTTTTTTQKQSISQLAPAQVQPTQATSLLQTQSVSSVKSSDPPTLQPVQPLSQVQSQQHLQPPQLTQQQPTAMATAKTPPTTAAAQKQQPASTSLVAPQTSTTTSRVMAKKQPVLAHIQIQPITSNSQPGATHSISITPSTGTTTISEETKAQILHDLINSKVLQQTLNLPGGMPKMLQLTATGGPNSHSYILTAAPSPPPPGALSTASASTAVSSITTGAQAALTSRSTAASLVSSTAPVSMATSLVTTTAPSLLSTTSPSSQRPQFGKAPKNNNQKKKKDKEHKNKLKVKQNNHINATSSGKPASSNTLPINGLNPSRASSVPSSPVTINKLHRTSTNPFFGAPSQQQQQQQQQQPSKDPPKYDEAIKNRQNVLTSDGGAGKAGGGGGAGGSPGGVASPDSLKSDAMDDVLEILIRAGELPPSAAQEPPPTPRTSAASASGTPSFQAPVASHVSTPASPDPFSLSPLISPSPEPPATATTLAAPSPHSVGSGDAKKQPPLVINTSVAPHTMYNALSPSTLTDTNLSDPLPGNLPDLPFISMEWSDSDTSMSTFDYLLDNPGAFSLQDKAGTSKDFLHLPGTSVSGGAHSSGGVGGGGSVHGSEPNLAVLGLSDDLGDPTSMNMDVSDWLDVMTPSAGLTPLSANAPVSFNTADPILTPKPQDVLDLFNMDESDLYQASDLNLDNPFEKPMELSTTKS